MGVELGPGSVLVVEPFGRRGEAWNCGKIGTTVQSPDQKVACKDHVGVTSVEVEKRCCIPTSNNKQGKLASASHPLGWCEKTPPSARHIDTNLNYSVVCVTSMWWYACLTKLRLCSRRQQMAFRVISSQIWTRPLLPVAMWSKHNVLGVLLKLRSVEVKHTSSSSSQRY